MGEELPTGVPRACFSPTLRLSKLVPESARFASLVDTENRNGDSGSIGVANGIGYRVGETITG